MRIAMLGLGFMGGVHLRALRDVARALGVDRRVEFIPGALGDAEKVRLLAGCGAVLCLPEREGCGGRHVGGGVFER